MTCLSILIIEDDVDIRETLCQLFELENFTVKTASNGREALEQLKDAPPPCAIILDILMPVMNGWDFLEERNQDKMLAAIPVVIISGIANRPKTLPNATTFIKKPIDFDALLHFIKESCHDSS